MIVQDVINYIEELSPLAYAENFDNVGLLVGDKNSTVSGVLVTLDTLENVIDEAIEKKCNLIVSFHPIIFSGLKKITGANYVERVVLKAIKNEISIYAMHTALDNCFTGVNAEICTVLGLKNHQVLIPQQGTIKKLVTYIPKNSADTVRKLLFEAGAGNIGNYSHCSFNTEGLGTFNGNEHSNPVIGERGKTQTEAEIQIGITYSKHLEHKVLKTLFKHHPYEEIAYEITTLENTNQHIGMGMVGELEKEIDEIEFLKFLKQKMNTEAIRHSSLVGKKIKKVAVLGGSGAFAIEQAKRSGADIFISSDIKYHEFLKAENEIIIADIGHYESEQFTKTLLVRYLTKKIPNFAVVLSVSNTNPVNYL